MWRICARFSRGTRAFGRLKVRGRSRVPRPPAIITACIERERTARRLRNLRGKYGGRLPGDDRDDVVPAEDDGPDPAHVLVLRLLRVLEDHVHVVVVADELALELAVVFQQELDPLVDGFFQNIKWHHHKGPALPRTQWARLLKTLRGG